MFNIKLSTKTKIGRVVAMYLLLNLVAELVMPLSAYALTGGPSQPEVESFEPVGTSEMVNLFSGDFNYNIPLLTVPGPNGGYPINMAYHAGISMEQEASWVGLGWNINPGVINRNMRGLPDDFKGDEVIKTLDYKPMETWALSWNRFDVMRNVQSQSTVFNSVTHKSTSWKEFFGLDSSLLPKPQFNYTIYYNNYKGIGHSVAINTTASNSKIFNHFAPGISLSYDTDGGLGVSPSISHANTSGKKTKLWTLSLGYSTRQGIYSLSLKGSKVTQVEDAYISNRSEIGDVNYSKLYLVNFQKTSAGAGVVFSSSGAIQQNNAHTTGSIARIGICIGEPNKKSIEFTKTTKKTFDFSLTNFSSAEIDYKYKSYGYSYLQNRGSSESYILDFNRDLDNPATKNSPSIGIGYGTQDIFQVSGQGVSGIFKPFRSEFLTFYDAPLDNVAWGPTLIQEFGTHYTINPASSETVLGGNIGVNYSHSYSGDWKNHLNGLSNMTFHGHTSADPLYEPVYYKSSGEMTASDPSDLDNINGANASRFDLKLVFDGGNGIVPAAEDNFVTDYSSQSSTSITPNTKRTTREVRSQLMTHRTSGQIHNTIGYGKPVVNLYAANAFPTTGGTPTAYNYGNNPDHHIGEVTVTNADGMRYVYGLPAYNTNQKDVIFAQDALHNASFAKPQAYPAGQDISTNNSEEQDHLFMSTEMPKYAYSYLLTAMYSADYVDLKGDGPTDDDFGYWVKFNYSRRYTNYSWRVPYQDANYMKNHLSDMNDDKLSYMYGEKEIYYLNSVETKTHAANFILDAQRQDALGAMNENFSSNQTSNQSLNALQSIELVSKKEPTKVLTKVHFEYDYSLCRNTPNSSASTKGKLTLKKLWFTHQGNSKGQLSPYEFSYENVDANNNPYPYDNPNYSQDEMDRWGFYKKDRIDAGFAITANENPYVDQKESVVPVHEYMGAWNLKTIKLPSGGEIRVTYESDDYAYVQDKAAMQMQRIVGTGNVTDVDANVNSATYGRAISNGNKLHDRNLIVFFDLEQTFNATNLTAADRREKIRPYVEGIDELYFKAFLELKKTPGLSPHNSYDYVEGYARPNKNQLWYGYGPLDGNGNVTTGWIRVTAEERNPWNPIGQTDHPFKLAGWQYLRMERQDLFDDGNLFSANNDITQTIQAFVNLANNAQRLLGYFNFCQSRGYCNELYLQRGGTDIIDPKPSWLRLNSPDKKKLGGGHRVKKITIDDDWKAMTGEGTQDFTYGTEYSYTMPDGSSSGVAEYEPLVGGEEIALRLPLRYDERRYPYKNDGLYTEEPFGESLYPGANVGYRRVIVKSLSRADVGVTKNRSGITVNEFYTAKDFPVLVDNTDLGKKNFTIPVIVPFIGEIGYSNKGYSQGFSVELNNMHGQMKGQAVYSSNANINDPNTIPVSKSEYIFLTNNTYDPTQANSLKSRVVVMDADGVYREADLGRTQELSVDRQEHSNFSINAGLQTDAGASPPYITWANALPYFEINSSLYRSVSTLKIIQRNGILSEVRQYKDGAYTSSKNLMYDAETGQPLLTQTTNNFDKPVFNYNYAAHWAYPTMGGAYKNVGAKFFGVTFVNGTYSPSTGYVGDYFTPGDEVEFQFPNVNTREIYWVSAVNTATNEITCMREDGTTSISNVNGTLTILRSGRRNQQSVSNGVIVALKNPVTERRFPLFDAFNQYASNGSHMNGTSYTFEKFYTDCATGQLKDVTITWNAPRLIFSLNAECTLEVVFPANSGITDLRSAFYFDLVLSGNQVVATSPENKFTCQLIRTGSCFKSCMDDVLHAEANRFQDVWSFNYLDNNDPSYKLATSNISTKFSSQLPINAYRFGTKGIWRSKDNWVYQVDRKQQTASASGSNIAIDGVYKHFIPYDWSATNNPAALNPQWTYTGEVTQYSPYGFELESKDALGIYSAALYGYEQSLSVAVGANTMYRELSSDGFEDYTTAYANATTAPHGHLRFVSANSNIPLVLDNQYAHTGNWSLKVGSTSPALMTTSSDQGATYNLFNPQAGQKYQLSLWVKTSAGANGQVQVKNTSTNTVLATVTPDPKKSAIEGWRRIELSFVAPAAGQTIQIELKCLSISSAEVWFDDIRIQPFTSGMKTYVYDLNSLWLLAELDDRNYATFYNYDEEGSLVQVKQETEKGIVTLRTSRGNIKRN